MSDVAARPIRPLRAISLVVTDWVFTLRYMSASMYFVLTSALQPVIFASIAFFLFRAGQRADTLLYASIGAGLMGIWSSTLFGSGGMIQWERFQGTLELLMLPPRPYVLTVTGAAVAAATLGVYSLVATLLWGWVLFDIPFEVAHPLLFALSIPATVLSLGFLGVLLASTFVLYRHANALSNLLEYPVWLITGLLIPLDLLPGWVRPISSLLAPTWGVRAIRGAALGGGDPAVAVAICIGLGIAYLAAGALFLRHFEKLARARATLALT